MKKTLLLISIATGLLFSCQKENIDPTSSLVGKWKYEYQILNDGSKSFNNPYALLEHTYNDGFILNSNQKGNTTISGSINDKEFEWAVNDSQLKIIVPYSDGSTKEFLYVISNLGENSMNFQAPKGRL